MEAIRRVGFLFFVLVIGIFLGTLGLRLAFMIWFMSWDEKRYTRKQQQARYVYRKFP